MRPVVEEIFHAVADLSPDSRIHYFDQHKIDQGIRDEVEELLSFDGSSTGSLEREIGDAARRAMERVDSPQADRFDGEIWYRVAVKLLRPGADGEHLHQRFLTERQILATLSHPNIAKLLDAGHRPDGQPFLVMEYVEGKTIDTYSDELSARQKVQIFLKVCAAVSHLHRNLVVHRDLKPANILVIHEGEPKLLDFGIAKLLDLSMDSTTTATRMLTLDYASPEQVTGAPITTAADIYSLGAVLYRLLTGVSPHQFGDDSAATVASAISTANITPPSKLAPDANGDLELVVMKALRKEPQERYVSVDALIDDLRACLENRPVQARAGDTWYRLRRWIRLHWLSAIAAAAVVLSLGTGLFFASRQRIAAERLSEFRQLSKQIFQKVLASGPQSDAYLPDATSLSIIYETIASLGRRTGLVELAAAFEARRLDPWQLWDSELPDNSFVRRQLSTTQADRPRSS
jgi:serine/threonine protein kinase